MLNYYDIFLQKNIVKGVDMSEKTIDVNEENFESSVLKSDIPVLVDFWAEWCGPCKQIAPILEEISSEYSNKLTVAKIDVDENPEMPSKYQVRGIPTMILFNNGNIVDTKVGMSSKQDLTDWLNQHLS